MQYSDTTNDDGIVQDARWLVSANSSSYPIKDLTRNVNRWYDKLVTKIIKANNTWQWDDSNYTNYPIATTNLVASQQDYTLEVSHLNLHRVEVLNENGQWTKLKIFDPSALGGQSIQEFEKNDGPPRFYDVIGNSIFLYPAAETAVTNGIKIWFQRKASYFATTDTTKEPGISEIFHRYLSLGAAYDYTLKNTVANKNDIKQELDTLDKAIVDFYHDRAVEFHTKLIGKTVNFR